MACPTEHELSDEPLFPKIEAKKAEGRRQKGFVDLTNRPKAKFQVISGDVSKITSMTNASGHTVKLPKGPREHFKERQRAALEIAKTLPRGQRGFALKLAKDAATSKRAWSSSQPRVPAGNPNGGQWAKK